MSYCVHCGVELDEAAKVCPLCHTPVVDPAALAAKTTEPFFPTKPAVVAPVSRQELALILSVMLAGAGTACGLLNLFMTPEAGWSLYIIAAVILLWIWFVLPLVTKGMPGSIRVILDVFAVGLYVYLVSVDLNGAVWFHGLALPILVLAALLLFLLCFFLRDHRVSMISRIALGIGTVGVFCLGVEFFADQFIHAEYMPGWSIVVLVVCIAFIVPLRIIRRVPSLREEARRRFHL